MLRDDARDKRSGCYVKGGIPAIDARRSYTMLAHVCHFAIGSHLDYNVIAAGYLQIDRCQRCSHIEGHSMMFGHNSNLICTNFVGRVAVGCHLGNIQNNDGLARAEYLSIYKTNPVRADHNGGYVFDTKQRCHHAVQHQGGG